MTEDEDRRVLRALEQDWQNLLAGIRKDYDELENDWRKAVTALERRNRRHRNWLIAISVATLLVVTVGLVVFDSVLDGQQRSREAAILDLCERTNETNDGIRDFITVTAPSLTTLAAQSFPVEGDCEGYAKQQAAPR